MRDYAKVVPTFWTGKTGKALRARGSEALIVGMYLMTSPQSNMLGLFYQPVLYMAHETGLGSEGALKGLRGAVEAGFCSFDAESEMVWVHEMAFFQIASELKATDNRCAGIQKDYDALPDNPFLSAFFDKYSTAFHLSKRRGSEAPCKPLPSQEQEQEQEQEQKQEKEPKGSSSPAKLPTAQTAVVIDLYHELLPEMPKARLQTEGRKRAIRKVWDWTLTSKKGDGSRRAETAEQALAWFRSYFERARDNDFLMGKTLRTGEHANWQCDLDFLLTEKGMKHVIEKTKEPA